MPESNLAADAGESVQVIARRLLGIDRSWPNIPEPTVEMGLLNFANGLVAEGQWTVKRLWQPSPDGVGHCLQPSGFDLLEILRRAANGELG
jgi:hypothetical protein